MGFRYSDYFTKARINQVEYNKKGNKIISLANREGASQTVEDYIKAN